MLILQPPPPGPADDAFHHSLRAVCAPALQHLLKKPDIEVTEKLLESLSIHKGRDLDPTAVDEGTQPDCFFVPHPESAEFGTSVGLAHVEKYPEGWPYCEEEHKRLPCAWHFSMWYTAMLTAAFPDGDSDGRLCHRDDHYVTEYSGADDHPHVYGHVPYDEEPEFGSDAFFRSLDPSKPHIGCILKETDLPREGKILRGEMVAGVELILHEVLHRKHPGHTIPAIVYTIGHTNAARVTQFHFDGKRLIYRQSKVFNLDHPDILEVVDDALELMRWMRCRPVGQTQVVDRR